VGIMYERFLTESYTAEILRLWIEEEDLAKILTFANIEIGDFHRIVELGNWISYSAKELAKELRYSLKYFESYNMYFSNLNEKDTAKLFDSFTEVIELLESIEIRLKYGIKSDLVKLVQIKHVGRVRARILNKAGINIKDLETISIEDLQKLPMFGPYISRLVLSQFNDRYAKELEENKEYVEEYVLKNNSQENSLKKGKSRKNKIKEKQKKIDEFF
jgi:helicase